MIGILILRPLQGGVYKSVVHIRVLGQGFRVQGKGRLLNHSLFRLRDFRQKGFRIVGSREGKIRPSQDRRHLGMQGIHSAP